ncbi:hypothetical protein MW887_007425 [Aspergillus wentii]|nr:hypothetical protein MW887_007425 [Aspergillus wentii]
MAAAKVMLDKPHPKLSQPRHDHNAYTLGEIGGHNIVIACLPNGVYGTTSAAIVADQMLSTFHSIRFGLMVGIGGGVPMPNDIRLGDIVVSKPTGQLGGVVQYDYGKTVASGRFERTGSLSKPPQVILTALANLEANHMIDEPQFPTYLSDVMKRNTRLQSKFGTPGQEEDQLFESTYDHEESYSDCSKCHKSKLIHRKLRSQSQIHYGLVASGNQVMKHGQTRDKLAQEHGILCFEMEAAGLMDHFPCLVIRGICDYSDSHKNKQWQGYAAMVAAAYAKELLSETSVTKTEKCKPTGKDSEVDIKPVYMIPFDRNPRFTGRGTELQYLESKMFTQNGAKKLAIAGLGGVGKTQIALELAYRVQEKHPECLIFWISSISETRVQQSYVNISRLLGMQDVKPTEAKERVRSRLSQEDAGQWLMIFDNADDKDMWISSDPSALKNYLPRGRQGCILLTTRNQQLAVSLAGPNLVKMQEMDDQTATDLFKASLVQKDLLDDHEATKSLLYQLGFLPLAIVQAASYINKNGTPLSTYLSLLQEQEHEAIELLSKDFEDEWRYDEAQNAVAITWLISFQEIQNSNSLAADKELHGWTQDREELAKYTGLYLKEEGQYNQAKALFEELLGRKIEKLGPDHKEALDVQKHLSRTYRASGEHKKAEELIEHVMDIQQRALGSDNPDTLTSLDILSNVYFDQGRYREAESLLVQVVEKRKTVLGADDVDTLNSIQKLAWVYRGQGRYDETEKLLEPMMETVKNALGLEHHQTLGFINSLALDYMNQGKLIEAEKLLTQVTEIDKRLHGLEHPDTLVSINNLAAVYKNQGRLMEAEELEQQALKMKKKILGPEHPDTLGTMGNLASTYYGQKKWMLAEDLEMQVLDTEKRVLGPKHPHTLISMYNLAFTWKEIGRDEDAMTLMDECAQLRKEVLGTDHPDTRDAMECFVDWSEPSPVETRR